MVIDNIVTLPALNVHMAAIFLVSLFIALSICKRQQLEYLLVGGFNPFEKY